MSKSWRQLQRGRRFGHGLITAILAMLPLLAIAGAMAPGVVAVDQEEEEEPYTASGDASFQAVRLAKRPLLVPRDYSAGFVPELLDLEQLFSGSDFRGEPLKRLTRLPSFPRSSADVIVLDDVDSYIGARIFTDVLDLSLVADTSHLDPDNWALIPPLWPAGNGLYYDDFIGGDGVPEIPPIIELLLVIPEPGTGLLVAFGMCGLALLQRAQRQPATS